MKKTLVVLVLISSLVANTAFAGGGRGGGYGGGGHGGGRGGSISPWWIPVAVVSTLAAVAVAQSPPPLYERRVYIEPRQTVIYEEPRRTVVYEEPRYYRSERYYEREPSRHYYDERERHYESYRYSDYR